MIQVVTSFSPDGYKLYGRQFIETFRRHWPDDVELVVYHEGVGGRVPGATCVDLLETEPCRSFLKRHAGSKIVSGHEQRRGDKWKSSAQRAGYNFRFDAYKFCRKVFALVDASRERTGKLFWIDADVQTHAPVDIDVIDALLPEGISLCYLDRPGYHSECGVVGYNLDAPGTREFIDAFEAMFADDLFFEYTEWHDSFLFDRLVDELKPAVRTIPQKNRAHPVETSVLGRYMRHFKGKRKDSRAAMEHHIRTAR